MDITLDFYPLLGLYLSPDFNYAYDPNAQQLYQQISPGNYQPVQADPYGGYSSYPSMGGYGPSSPYNPYSAPSAPASPVYVNPPRPGITFAPTIIRQPGQPAQPVSSAPQPTPTPTTPRVVVAPAVTPATGSTGTYQAPPAPRTGVPAPPPRVAAPTPVGSGGTVKMASEQPDPSKGYWEAFHLMGWWSAFPEQKDFYQASYPVKKVRMTDGVLWPTPAMAIYQGRDAKRDIYIMLYESEEDSYPWTKPADKLKMVQVKPVLPF